MILCSYSLNVLKNEELYTCASISHAIDTRTQTRPGKVYWNPYYDRACNFRKNEQLEKDKNTDKEFVAGVGFQFIKKDVIFFFKGCHSEIIRL